LKSFGWDRGSFNDYRGDQTSPAEGIYDPLNIIEVIVGVRGLYKVGRSVIPLLVEYLCLDGNCGNEFEMSSHAVRRLFYRGVSLEQMNQALQFTPFKYFHEGVWKLGYYDPNTRVFIGTVNNIITTVISNASPQYIENLKRLVP
jgi:hypothetical protein